MVSIVFYAWGEPINIVLLLGSVTINWAAGLLIERSGSSGGVRKTILVITLFIDLILIGLFKYQGFFSRIVNRIVGAAVVPNLNLPLPIGISFYTLQAISYVLDVYRGEIRAQGNPLYLGMYVACWPQLVAGPIVRYADIEQQILDRRETLDKFAQGVRIFCIGFAKKVLLADAIAILANDMLSRGAPAIGFVGAWAGVIAYTFQLYFDFSGYSDMAIGLGKMMGFEYLRNFNWPYISRSGTEFWRRWHISLSSFFRDYVYIPLGGSRVSKPRWVINIAIVWGLTGLWHGAATNYVLWGLWWGTILICEKLLWGKLLANAPRLLQHVYTCMAFLLGWSLFWITRRAALFDWWRAMFGAYGLTGTSTFWELQAWNYWPLMLVCIVASTPFVSWLKYLFDAYVEGREVKGFLEDGLPNTKHLETLSLCRFDAKPMTRLRSYIYATVAFVVDALLAVAFVMSVASLVMGNFSPFVYFQF